MPLLTSLMDEAVEKNSFSAEEVPQAREVSTDLVRAPSPSRSKRNKQAKKKSKSPSLDEHKLESLPLGGNLTPLGESMTAGSVVPLFIASIGNPGAQYASTLHSAGHIVLNRLAQHLGFSQFTKSKDLAKGLVAHPSGSEHATWTLWQSPSYMNESGKAVRAAYNTWLKSVPEGQGKLVVVHDELEKPLGSVTVKTALGASAKGHNGLKSLMAVMGNTAFVRIGVGIGRPTSRSSDDVARFVLQKVDQGQKKAIEGSVEGVVAKLREVERG